MMKHLKKLTLIITAAFLFCLTTVNTSGGLIPLPSVTVDEEQPDNQEKPDVQPMSDKEDEDEGNTVKSL